MDDLLLADIVLVAHFGYAGFVVFGFVAVALGATLGWGWIRNRIFRYLHMAAIAFVGLEAVIGMACPLTEIEYALRSAAGAGAGEGTFIGRIVGGLLFYDLPLWVFNAAYVALTVLAVALLLLVPPRRRGSGSSV